MAERQHDRPRISLGDFQSAWTVAGSSQGALETEAPALDTRGAVDILRTPSALRRRAELVSALSLDGNRVAVVEATPLDEARLSSRLPSCPGPEIETPSRFRG